MADTGALLAALQYADGQFPGGGFAFSWGMEGLHAAGLLHRAELTGFIEGQLRHRWATMDRPIAAHAHGLADDPDALAELDHQADLLIAAAPLRDGSIRAGRALLGIHARLGTPGCGAYRGLVQAERAHGHLAVVQGAALGGAGLDLRESLAVTAYQLVAGFCTAAIRLGLASHLDGQRALTALRPVIAELVALPVQPVLELATFTPLAEIAMMRHATQKLRLFST